MSALAAASCALSSHVGGQLVVVLHRLLLLLLLLCLLLASCGDEQFELAVQLLAAVGVDVRVIVRLLDGGELCQIRPQHTGLQTRLLGEGAQLRNVSAVLVSHGRSSGRRRAGRSRGGGED